MKNLLIVLGCIVFSISITQAQDATYDNVNIHQKLNLGGGLNAPVENHDSPDIYRSVLQTGASFPFNQNGNLILQTRSSAPRNIVFMTGNPTPLPAMVINNDGNVGIGTSLPGTKLHVFNGSSGGTPHSFADEVIEDDDNAMLVLLTPSDKTSYYGFGDADDQYVGGMQYNHSSDELIFRVNNHPNDLVINSNGNVGIGTMTPNAGLELKNDNGIRISALNNGGFPVRLRMVDGIEEGPNGRDDFLAETDGAFLIKLDRNANGISRLAGFGIYDDNNNNLFFVGESNGNVGIGTTNTFGYKLAVNGSIGAKEVNSAWPDYVFTPTYQLPSLEELEIYINENQHLPGMPSAQEVEKDGVKLGEMNAKLLEKVEELTLYVIELEKRVKELDTNRK